MFHRQGCFQKLVERNGVTRCLASMHDPSYYRDQAERARRLAMEPTDRETKDRLREMSQDYLDIAEDLESGAVEIRHPQLTR
jgi:hypothetical protein